MIKIKFQYRRSVRNTHVFREVRDDGSLCENMRDGHIGQLYVKKTAFGSVRTAPQELEVTIKSSAELD